MLFGAPATTDFSADMPKQCRVLLSRYLRRGAQIPTIYSACRSVCVAKSALHHLVLLPRYGRTMSGASAEAPPPFQSKLPDVEKWFRDRQLHYSKGIEDRLIAEGVESLEEMKLFDDWPELLRNEESPDYYPKIKWRKFEMAEL